FAHGLEDVVAELEKEEVHGEEEGGSPFSRAHFGDDAEQLLQPGRGLRHGGGGGAHLVTSCAGTGVVLASEREPPADVEDVVFLAVREVGGEGIAVVQEREPDPPSVARVPGVVVRFALQEDAAHVEEAEDPDVAGNEERDAAEAEAQVRVLVKAAVAAEAAGAGPPPRGSGALPGPPWGGRAPPSCRPPAP